AFLKKEPVAKLHFKRWIGSEEFINGSERWCLWLGDCTPDQLQKMPESMKRIEAVKQTRLASKSAPTRKIAATPTRFHVENMPSKSYLVVPKVSSERRNYIPIGFELPSTLASDLVFIIPNATLYHLGILSSVMHMSWVRSVCGRLESRYRYSAGIVYNNFPWPDATGKQRQKIEKAAQGVLDARAKYPKSTLADLYNSTTMPPDLVKAHDALDKAVDEAYGKTGFKNEAQRVAFLFELYQKITSPLAPETKKEKPRKLKAKKTS
ncbi:MAG: type IIL restriction-modification enzyme MmeI, partial [Pseudomonadota bacterium]